MSRHTTGGLRGPGLFQSRTKRLETHPFISCSPPVTQYTEPEGNENAIARSCFLFGKQVLCVGCNLALLKVMILFSKLISWKYMDTNDY